MKTYNIDNQLSAIFEKHGAFWAFGDEQFNERKKEGIKYVSMGAGLICPKEAAKVLTKDMNKAIKGAVEWELANNTKKEIIWHQLSNHECQISHDYSDVVDILRDYGITAAEIATEWQPYFDHCVKNDCF